MWIELVCRTSMKISVLPQLKILVLSWLFSSFIVLSLFSSGQHSLVVLSTVVLVPPSSVFGWRRCNPWSVTEYDYFQWWWECIELSSAGFISFSVVTSWQKIDRGQYMSLLTPHALYNVILYSLFRSLYMVSPVHHQIFCVHWKIPTYYLPFFVSSWQHLKCILSGWFRNMN